MNDNEKLKYYLLSWYNLYKKGHEVCVQESSYKQSNSLASLDEDYLFFHKMNNKKNEEVKKTFFEKTSNVKKLNDELIVKICDVIEEYNYDEDTKNKINQINEEYKQQIAKDNEFMRKTLKTMMFLRFLPLILLAGTLGGFVSGRSSDLIIGLICLVIFFILEGISLNIYIKRKKILNKYKEDPSLQNERMNKIAKLKKSASNHTVPDKIPSELLKFKQNYMAAKNKKYSESEFDTTYFQYYITFDDKDLVSTVNEVIADYNNPEITSIGNELISECAKAREEFNDARRNIVKPYQNYESSLKETIQKLKEIRTKLRDEFPIPYKYENENSIACLLSLALDGRCDTLKEAINLMEDEKFKSEMLNSLHQINRNITMQSEILISGFSTIIEQNNDINKQLSEIKTISIATFLEQ